MNTSNVRRFTFLSAAAIAALACSTGAIAGPSVKALEVLGSQTPVTDLQLPKHALANSGVLGVLNPGALSASALELTLADGRKINARLQRVARDDRKGTQSWIGTFDDSPGSVVVFTRAKGVVTGLANYQNQTLEILPSSGGKHLLFAVDNARLPQREEVERVATAADTATDGGYGLGTSMATLPASGVVHDVLVVYTAASASRYGQASLESMIQSAVQSANQAYLNSQVGITMNLVGTAQVGFAEGSSMGATKSTLQADAAVANLRNQLGADVVMLVSENSDYCGLASLMSSNSTSFAPSAYGVVYSSCLSNQSLAHEVGHTQGLMHDRDSSSGWAGVFPYSYGYRRCVSDGTGFRDIMSYSCSGAPRVLVFSNPYVNWNGYPAGIAYETNPASSAENARTLINTAATVAAFRSGSSSGPATAPAAPSGLAVQSAVYNSVTIGWSDNSTNETGFKVERSGDGVSFVEVGSVGADTRSFADKSVAALSKYFYRVRAYNSTGGSGYSGTINVTTPDLPPPPPPAPTIVAARDNGDGTALTSWSANTASVTSFEVRREKWDTRKSAWGSSTIAATVPATVTSIVDSTGAGTYRYFVRALNSGGASNAAGPASVTVTNSTAAKGKGRPK